MGELVEIPLELVKRAERAHELNSTELRVLASDFDRAHRADALRVKQAAEDTAKAEVAEEIPEEEG